MENIYMPESKKVFEKWIEERGGVVVWTSQEIGTYRGNIYTPAKTPEGEDGTKHPPHWAFGNPVVHTTLDGFRFVREMKEVKRFHVAVKRGSGLQYVLTDASARKVRKALDAAAGEDAVYNFDYTNQEAVVELPVWEE